MEAHEAAALGGPVGGRVVPWPAHPSASLHPAACACLRAHSAHVFVFILWWAWWWCCVQVVLRLLRFRLPTPHPAPALLHMAAAMRAPAAVAGAGLCLLHDATAFSAVLLPLPPPAAPALGQGGGRRGSQRRGPEETEAEGGWGPEAEKDEMRGRALLQQAAAASAAEGGAAGGCWGQGWRASLSQGGVACSHGPASALPGPSHTRAAAGSAGRAGAPCGGDESEGRGASGGRAAQAPAPATPTPAAAAAAAGRGAAGGSLLQERRALLPAGAGHMQDVLHEVLVGAACLHLAMCALDAHPQERHEHVAPPPQHQHHPCQQHLHHQQQQNHHHHHHQQQQQQQQQHQHQQPHQRLQQLHQHQQQQQQQQVPSNVSEQHYLQRPGSPSPQRQQQMQQPQPMLRPRHRSPGSPPPLSPLHEQQQPLVLYPPASTPAHPTPEPGTQVQPIAARAAHGRPGLAPPAQNCSQHPPGSQRHWRSGSPHQQQQQQQQQQPCSPAQQGAAAAAPAGGVLSVERRGHKRRFRDVGPGCGEAEGWEGEGEAEGGHGQSRTSAAPQAREGSPPGGTGGAAWGSSGQAGGYGFAASVADPQQQGRPLQAQQERCSTAAGTRACAEAGASSPVCGSSGREEHTRWEGRHERELQPAMCAPSAAAGLPPLPQWAAAFGVAPEAVEAVAAVILGAIARVEQELGRLERGGEQKYGEGRAQDLRGGLPDSSVGW